MRYSRLAMLVARRWRASIKSRIPVEMEREPRASPVRKLIWI
jgi:hypothetical protein